MQSAALRRGELMAILDTARSGAKPPNLIVRTNASALPSFDTSRLDLNAMMSIAIPPVLTNLATPVASPYSMRDFSGFGEAAVAAFAIVDRLNRWPSAFYSHCPRRSARSSAKILGQI
ncbi:MAG: hypothetical protein ACRECU_00865 [Methylocella sp.]